MILVTGHLQLRPGDIDRLGPALASQIAATRAFDGCFCYALGRDVDAPDRLRIAERWRDRAAHAAHLIGDHMAEFNIAMRAARVSSGELDAYDGGTIRKILELPAVRFRPEREDKSMVIVMGHARFSAGEIDRLKPEMEAQLNATRAENGCELYVFARDVLDPDLLHISERWRDNAAIAAHFASPHMAAFNNALATARIEELSVKAYDAEGERVLMRR